MSHYLDWLISNWDTLAPVIILIAALIGGPLGVALRILASRGKSALQTVDELVETVQVSPRPNQNYAKDAASMGLKKAEKVLAKLPSQQRLEEILHSPFPSPLPPSRK